MYWYTPTELAKRMGFYHSCQAIGSMMSGALQTAILNTVDGAHGIAGWRWLFIINACMTVVVGAAGFFMLPDYPSTPNPRAFWFTAEHSRMAVERLERHGRAEAKRITWAAARRTAGMWVSYFIPLLYIATVLAQYGYNYFSLFLKSVTNADGTPRWTTSQVNSIPIGGSAINVVFVWVWAILSDVLQTRWTLLVAQAAVGLVPAIAMSVWTRHPTSTPIGAAYASYFLSYICLGTAPLIMSWLSDLIPQDPEARTLILGYAIAGVYAIIAWSQVLVWPSSEAPYCECKNLFLFRDKVVLIERSALIKPFFFLSFRRQVCLAGIHRAVGPRYHHGDYPARRRHPISPVSLSRSKPESHHFNSGVIPFRS